MCLCCSDFNAQLGDFGAARVGFISDRSALVGTPGFVDPEYAITGRFTEKSDVFSFGMLMLVLISGCRMMESHSSGTSLLAISEVSQDWIPSSHSIQGQ
jgi:interleukin-1 receptor-associated kinase 1/somatic embryogenesis receptor kinase 1